MDRVLKSKKSLFWVGGALLLGTAALAFARALDVDLDFEPWDEMFPV